MATAKGGSSKTRKATKFACKTMNMSIKPPAFKRLAPISQVAWHMCYSKQLTRRAAHIKRQREKRWLVFQAKDQLKWAESIRRRHKVGPVEVE